MLVSVEVFLNGHNDLSGHNLGEMVWLMYKLAIWICPAPLKAHDIELSQHIVQDLSSMEPAAESPDPHNGVDCEGFTEPEQTPHIRHPA